MFTVERNTDVNSTRRTESEFSPFILRKNPNVTFVQEGISTAEI